MQCANHSAGPANQLFGLLLQTLVQAQCSISPPEMWPKDYGQIALEKGKTLKQLKIIIYQKISLGRFSYRYLTCGLCYYN